MTDDLQERAREVLARWEAVLEVQANADFLTSYTIGAEELRALVELATPRPVETGEVIQADRDAAADVIWPTSDSPAVWHAVKHGNDDAHYLVQAFKKHRLAFASPTPEPSGADTPRAYRIAYAPLRSAQHALDIIARTATRCNHGGLASEESARIEAALASLDAGSASS